MKKAQLCCVSRVDTGFKTKGFEKRTAKHSSLRGVWRHPLKLRSLEMGGAFHYAKQAGQRSLGIPEKNGTTFSD